MKLADPNQVLQEVFADVFAEREHLPPSEWAERYRMLTARAGARPGPWRNATNPALVEIMDAWANPAVSRIILKASAQAGKTELLINCMLWSADNERLPMMYVSGNTDLARSFMQDRLAPTIEEMPRLRRIRTGRKWDEKAKQFRFASSDLFVEGANSATGLASRPIARLFPDEIDKWADTLKQRGRTEGRALELARARGAAFGASFKEMASSTPTDEGVGIDAEYAASDQRERHVPCLACGRYQALAADSFDRVRWDVPAHLPQDDRVGRNLDDDALALLVAHVKRTAWYECRHCGATMDAAARPRMLAAGLWVASGQAVEGLYDSESEPAHVVGDPPATDVRGYWLHGLASPFRTWGDIAAGFVQLRGQPDRAWVNNTLGEAWREPGERADHHDLHRIHTQRNEHAPSYDRGTVPAFIGGEPCDRCPLVLTGAIDVQVDRVYIQVDGWGAEQTRTVVDFDVLRCPEISELRDSLEDEEQDDRVLLADAWAEVQQAVFRRYPVERDDGRTMPVKFWAIDAGYRTREVYAFARRINALAPQHHLPQDCMLPSKGMDQLLTGIQVKRIERDRDGNLLKHAVPLLQFDVNSAKDEANRRLHLRMPQPMATVLPRNTPHEYTRQLASEERVQLGARGRQQRMVWRMRPGKTENHYWDTNVLGLVLAEYRGLRTLRAPGATPARRRNRSISVTAG